MENHNKPKKKSEEKNKKKKSEEKSEEKKEEPKENKEIKILENKKEIREIKLADQFNLEEEVEDIEDMDHVQFQNFLRSRKFGAPVLEKLVDSSPTTNFDQGINPRFSSSEEKTEENSIKYSPNTTNYFNESERNKGGSNETKYDLSLRVPTLNSREISTQLPKQEFLDPNAGRGFVQQDNMWPQIIKSEVVERKMKLPFEQNEEHKKYREIKL